MKVTYAAGLLAAVLVAATQLATRDTLNGWHQASLFCFALALPALVSLLIAPVKSTWLDVARLCVGMLPPLLGFAFLFWGLWPPAGIAFALSVPIWLRGCWDKMRPWL